MVVDPSNFVVGGPLEGYTQTGDPDFFGMMLPPGEGDDQTTAPVILAPGDVFLNVDFGYQPPANRTTRLATRCGSMPTPTVCRIRVSRDPGRDGRTDPRRQRQRRDRCGRRVLAADTTDADGMYLFEGLPDGSYIVVVTDTDHVLGEFEQSSDPDAVLDGMSSVVDLEWATTLGAGPRSGLRLHADRQRPERRCHR